MDLILPTRLGASFDDVDASQRMRGRDVTASRGVGRVIARIVGVSVSEDTPRRGRECEGVCPFYYIEFFVSKSSRRRRRRRPHLHSYVSREKLRSTPDRRTG